MSINDKIVASLDIGTAKLSCLIAEISDKNIRIIGYSYRQSAGIFSSAVTDMKLAQIEIAKTIADAEKMAGFNINKLVINISGVRLDSITEVVSNKIPHRIIKNSDIMKLVSVIKSYFEEEKKEIIHLIPLEYKIDNINKVINPKYMSADTLEAKFYAISTENTIIKNIENCMKSLTISVNNYVADAYAASLSVINKNELNFGTLVIDIGSNSTSFAIIVENKLYHIDHCPLGGSNITRDIASILNINLDFAENIKLLNNSLIISPINEKDIVKFYIDKDDYPKKLIELTKLELKNIMSARIEEIINMVKSKLQEKGYADHYINNIIITGGVANMVGIEQITFDIFKKNTSIGNPIGIKDLPKDLNNPCFSVAIGMLFFLRQILKKESGGNFEMKNGWIRKAVDYLMSV
jgi:cell division protein FtsA